MAIYDDYAIVGASGDNFDCNDTGGWTRGGNAYNATLQDNCVEGDKSLGLQTSDNGESWWYHDISAGNRFVITKTDLGIWFYYIKGKGDKGLVQNSTAIVIRLYFGGTEKYADYRLTERGDLDLKFGWQMLMCSGTNLRGGDVGGGHNGGSDFELEVHRFELRLNCANRVDVNLGLDAIFVGTQIEIKNGEETPESLMRYAHVTRSGFPIGVIDIDNDLMKIMCNIKKNKDGALQINNKFIAFDQFSSEVTHGINVLRGSLQFGEIIDDQPTNGCTLAKPDEMSANIMVNNRGEFRCYNTKFYQWNMIIFKGKTTLMNCDFSKCKQVKVNSSNQISMRDIEIHDASTYAAAMVVDDNTEMEVDTIKVYLNKTGIRFMEDSTMKNADVNNNERYDVKIDDDKDVQFIDSSIGTYRES